MNTQTPETDYIAASPSISIDYDSVNDWLCITWTGNQSKESILLHAKTIEAEIRKTRCRKILNLNSNFNLSWQEAPMWAVKSWFPRLFILGCTSFAWVLSPQAISNTGGSEVFKTTTPFLQAMVFAEKETAAAWLSDN